MDVVDALEFGLLGDDTDVAHKTPACSQARTISCLRCTHLIMFRGPRALEGCCRAALM